jgi:hypothetical protein
MLSYRPKGVTIAATAIKATMNNRKHAMKTVARFAENVAAESVPRIVGQYDECRKRPMTDLSTVSAALMHSAL